MPTTFTPVVAGEVIEPEHVNRYIAPLNNLEKWREGSLGCLGDQNLDGHLLGNLGSGRLRPQRSPLPPTPTRDCFRPEPTR